MKNTIFTIAILLFSILSMGQNAQIVTEKEPVLVSKAMLGTNVMCGLWQVPGEDIYIFGYKDQMMANLYYQNTYDFKSFQLSGQALELMKESVVNIASSKVGESISLQIGDVSLKITKKATYIEFAVVQYGAVSLAWLTKAQLKKTLDIKI